MVYEVKYQKRRIFLESLIFTLLVLLLGFSLGFYIEQSRTDALIEAYRDYEIRALDLKLQNYYYQIMDRQACEVAIEQNFQFADDLYVDGLRLEEYQEADQIGFDLQREHKRYVLLKTELWLNSLLLKEKCGEPFDTVVYFYAGDPTSSATVAEQKVLANVLKTVKEERGNKIVLLPIAGDFELQVVDLQMKAYGVERLPSILINERVVLEGFHSPEEVLGYLG